MTAVRARTLLAGAAALVLLVALLAAAGWPASAYRDDDFFQFWAGPHALFEGTTPYDVAWSVGFHDRYGSRELHQPPLPPTGTPGWSTAYPLWTFVLVAPLALLPFALAAPAWLVLNALAIALGVLALARTVLVTRRRRDGFVLAGLAAAFQPAWLALAGGNVTGILFGLLAGALAAALAGRPRLAGALLGLLVVKPQAFVLVAVAFVLAARERRRLLEGAGAVVVALAAGSFVLRPGWLGEWLRSSAALQSSHGSNATAWTLDRAVGLGPAAPAALLALVVVAWAWWWRARRPPFATLVAATVPASLLVAPHGWSYDQLHLLVTVAVLLEATALRAGRVAWLVAIAVAAVPLPWALYVLAFSRGGEEWSVVTPLVLVALLVAADARAGARRAVVAGSPA